MTLLTRRDLLLGGAAAVGALAARPSRAAAASAAFDGEIRVLGIGYEDLDSINKRALRDLGIRIVHLDEFETVVDRLVRQQPASFDILSTYTQEVVGYWATGNLQPVEIARIRRWGDITPLYTLGRAQPGSARCQYGQGDAAFRRLYL